MLQSKHSAGIAENPEALLAVGLFVTAQGFVQKSLLLFQKMSEEANALEIFILSPSHQ